MESDREVRGLASHWSAMSGHWALAGQYQLTIPRIPLLPSGRIVRSPCHTIPSSVKVVLPSPLQTLPLPPANPLSHIPSFSRPLHDTTSVQRKFSDQIRSGSRLCSVTSFETQLNQCIPVPTEAAQHCFQQSLGLRGILASASIEAQKSQK